MAKILVIRKQDKTIHKAKLSQKAFLQSYNNRLPQAQKFAIEEMEEDEAKELPFIDSSYVTAGEATKKLATVNKQLAAKDDEIAQLKALLEQAQAGKVSTDGDARALSNKQEGPGAPSGSTPASQNNAAEANQENGEVKMTSANTEALPIGGSQAAKEPVRAAVNYERMSNPALMEELQKRQIAFDPAATKKAFVKLLTDNDAAIK